MQAKLFALVPKDFLKGIITAILTVIVTSVTASLEAGVIPTSPAFWKTQAIIGLSAGGAYLLKNLATNSKDEFLKKEPTKKE
jgi:hypothetical protein